MRRKITIVIPEVDELYEEALALEDDCPTLPPPVVRVTGVPDLVENGRQANHQARIDSYWRRGLGTLMLALGLMGLPHLWGDDEPTDPPMDVPVAPEPRPARVWTVTLDGFAYGDSTLTGDHLRIVREQVCPRYTEGAKVIALGGADPPGDHESNHDISIARAKAAGAFIRAACGVDPNDLLEASAGAPQPEGRVPHQRDPRHRKVVIHIIHEEAP